MRPESSSDALSGCVPSSAPAPAYCRRCTTLGHVHQSSHRADHGAPCSNILLNEFAICSLCFILMKLWITVRLDLHLRCSAAIQASFFSLRQYLTHCSTAVEFGSSCSHLQHAEYVLTMSLVGLLGTGVQARKFISKPRVGMNKGKVAWMQHSMCLECISFLWAVYSRSFYNTSASSSANMLLWGCAHEIKYFNFYVCFYFFTKTAMQVFSSLISFVPLVLFPDGNQKPYIRQPYIRHGSTTKKKYIYYIEM